MFLRNMIQDDRLMIIEVENFEIIKSVLQQLQPFIFFYYICNLINIIFFIV